MSVFQLCAMALGGLFIVLLLRQYHPAFALTVSLVLSVLLMVQALQLVQEVRDTLRTFFDWALVGRYGIVLKALGIGLIVQTTAELCREAGQPALESKVILLGKLLILTTALPLIAQVLELLTEILL